MPELPRPNARQLAAGVAVAVLAFVWPVFSSRLVELFGVRALAGSLLLVSAGSLFALGRTVPRELSPARSDSLALIALVAASAASGERVFLLLVPGFVQLAIARIFWRSLRQGESIFERVAFAIQPYAPDFIRPYCRTSTRLWAWLFLANALGVALLAFAAPLESWQAFTGWIVWVVMAVVAAIDFAVRKLYFRLYGPGPLDRLLARVFPANNTEMGRRANAYRRERRISLGIPP